MDEDDLSMSMGGNSQEAFRHNKNPKIVEQLASSYGGTESSSLASENMIILEKNHNLTENYNPKSLKSFKIIVIGCILCIIALAGIAFYVNLTKILTTKRNYEIISEVSKRFESVVDSLLFSHYLFDITM